MIENEPFSERFPDPGPPSIVPPRGQKHLLAVGGGRGGVGKSLVTINLAVYLAQLGRSVAVVDADLGGANLHTGLGLDVPPVPSADERELGLVRMVPTIVPGLSLVGASVDPSSSAWMRPGRRSLWAALFKQIQADFVVVNLGAGLSPGTLDLFSMADVGLTVTVPEPPAIEATYTFLRALFLRRLRRAVAKERFKLRLVERALAELAPMPFPPRIVEALERTDISLAEAAQAELDRLAPRLVVNGTRVRADIELGPQMQAIADRFLGMSLEYLGHVEQDDAVWLAVRRRKPLLADSPTSKSARLLERIARRVVASTAVLRETKEPRGTLELVHKRRFLHYDRLGVPRGASDEEVRRASKRQRELFSPGSLPLVSILDDAGLKEEQARLDEAHDTLLDPNRRRAYDASVFPDIETDQGGKKPRRPMGEDQALLLVELEREIQTATEFTGAFLRRIREVQGLELSDIAQTTKISLAHLSAIEDERWEDLPAMVYARGFVRELAKILKLDAQRVDRTYQRRLREGFLSLGRPVE